MIINIRGTHGSGKSTVVKSILDRYPNAPIMGTGKKPEGYKLTIPWIDRPLYIVGAYMTACGGCDAIQPYSLIWPRVIELARRGHVIFEGALVSNSYGNIGRDSEEFGDQFVFAFMNTPLEVCIARILKRRAEKGNTSLFDPNKSVVRIYKSCQSVLDKCHKFGRRVVIIDHQKAVPQVLAIFRSSQ